MTIFRNKANGKLYMIENLVHDMKFMNCGEYEGIYAMPYNWQGETIKYLKGSWMNQDFNSTKFIEENFEIVSKV